MGALKKIEDVFETFRETCAYAKSALGNTAKEIKELAEREELENGIAALSSMAMGMELMKIFGKISELCTEQQHDTICKCARKTIQDLKAGIEPAYLLLAWEITYRDICRDRRGESTGDTKPG